MQYMFMYKNINRVNFLKKYHDIGRCKFLPKIDLTSLVNLNASRMGRRFNRAVSDGSANQETIGIALSK